MRPSQLARSAMFTLGAVMTLAAGAGCDGRGAGPKSATSSSALATSGASGPYSVTGPTVQFLPSGRPPLNVRVEVADEEPERRRGLMDRSSLEAQAGMLFVFERPDIYTFWMKDTYLPLDLIYFDDGFRVLAVLPDVPPLSETPRAPRTPFRYVLEVNAGSAARWGVGAGTPVRVLNIGPVGASTAAGESATGASPTAP